MNATFFIHRRQWSIALAALLLTLSLTACGGPQPTPTPAPTPTPTVTPTPTPTPQPADGAAVLPAGAAQIVITEQQINDQLQSALAGQQGLPISDLAVNLKPGVLAATGKVTLGFLNADVEVSVRLNAVDGKIAPEVVDILLDGRPAPAMLKGQVDAFLQPLIEEASRTDYGFFVESVEVTENEIRVYSR
ncbi:LmeA family phospholipid-binding protein [Caldilinea sp.]|uniref:LmeA family phospholipid-binding protein n=1 Tax=Caldilinea sp. TaxID=2293560 RepID=UPI0021DCA588|nr:LmeA family phospholipid-binding protein [Caldilinea sp.]GIV69878.1 MAG: hypothetical protein KatS3mg048_2740 [Caldilinea sp.]